IRIASLHLTVEVDEVHQLVIQNDLSPLEAGKPLEPFGPFPKLGSNWYLGSEEVFSKSISTLNVHLEWAGLPGNGSLSDLQKHYLGYLESGAAGPSLTYQAKIQLRDKTDPAGWKTLKLDQALFEEIYMLSGMESLTGIPTGELNQFDPSVARGFLRLQLNGQAEAFFHAAYPQKLALQTLAASKDPGKKEFVLGAIYRDGGGTVYDAYESSSNKDTFATYFAAAINEPYTPQLQRCYLSYTATSQPDADAWYQLDAFEGFVPLGSFIETHSPTQLAHWLPQHRDEGSLFIGLERLSPPQILPLLIQVAEETADTEVEKAEVRWSYLHQNKWLPLEAHQTEPDTTEGLITSGIVQVQIPADIQVGNTRLPSHLFWLRAHVPERSGAICELIGVHTQAVAVAFWDQENDPNFLANPLAAENISKLAIKQAEVKGVLQPYASFGGRTKEESDPFYTRVSEHLRHKGRAITLFDYERLVLEAFPQVYKVRCISHTNDLRELSPGFVTLAVVPDLSQAVGQRELQPKVNVNVLNQIKTFLQPLHSPFAAIEVLNPKYEPIQVEFRVRFYPGRDSGYYLELLQTELQQFLAPWAFDVGAEIHFGGQVYPSSILNFVEEREYVDYVLDFFLHKGAQKNLPVVQAESARSILVSAATHLITEITDTESCPENDRNAEQKGYGYNSLQDIELEP
ncbi:MAG: baseplate J/gp47 family protein, partial [Bacteroidota bacterium]